MWEGGNVASEGGIVNLANKNAKEDGSFVVGIGLKLGVYLDDKCRGDCGEQTSLCSA
jgi:hypothetical protein